MDFSQSLLKQGSDPQRVLGVDPGLLVTGYGLIEANAGCRCRVVEAGCIRTALKTPLSKRLRLIHDQMREVIRELRPDVLVIEELYSSYKHPRTALKMAHARGVICLLASLSDVPLVGYTAKRIRKALTGNGNAGKGQVADMVAHWLRLDEVPKPQDVTDALGVAIGYVLIHAESGVAVS